MSSAGYNEGKKRGVKLTDRPGRKLTFENLVRAVLRPVKSHKPQGKA